jgi:bifunctional DNA-binding transcriptional regulator/antitoxin component of YhaV-PrlF toxin-antitoxin module
MATVITVDGQVTISKKILDAAGLEPGDRVEVRPRVGGGLVVERAMPVDRASEAAERIERTIADLRRQGIRPAATSDDLMRLLRGEE